MTSSVKTALSTVARAPIGYWSGFTYPFKGLRFVYFKHPKLIRFWIFPILITLLSFCMATWASWNYSSELLELVWAKPESDGWLSGVEGFFFGLVDIVLSLLLWVASAVVLALMTSVIAAPFNSALSAAVEQIVAGSSSEGEGLASIARDLGRTLSLELIKLSFYLLVMIPLFAIQCIVPGIGSILYSIFAFLFTAWFWGIDYMDWPAERRGWSSKERFRNAKTRFLTMFGFGSGVWLFLFIPFLNLFFMPAAVAGGTLLFLDLERKGQ